MKLRRLICFVALIGAVLAMVSMTSCTSQNGLWADVKTEYALLRQEWSEIQRLVTSGQWSTAPSDYAAADTPDSAVSPMLGMTPHTELLLSPYNRASGAATLRSAGIYAAELTDGGAGISEAKKYGYTAVPYFEDYSVEQVVADLQAVGIEAETAFAKNPAPAGEVFAVRYAGASDSEGFYINPAVQVTLFVSDAKPANTAETGDGLVYLTFDDGPSATTTLDILDILDTYGVKATFFTLGVAMEKHPDIAKNIADRGHNLGCHSFTHVYEDIYRSPSALEDEVILWEKEVESLGITVEDKLFRFPGGSVGGKLELSQIDPMLEMLNWHGYTTFDWGVSANDAVLYTAEDGVGAYEYIKESFMFSLNQRVKVNKREGGGPVIILLHENVEETVDLLPWMLEYLMSEGYTFGVLADLEESWMFERDMK